VSGRRVAVLGGGWAGLAAAVTAVERGHAVTLYEMAAQLGGRARTLVVDGHALDNGQHILIGAYSATLGLMRRVGVDPAAVLHRSPLRLVDADGAGLVLPAGAPTLAFARGVLGHPRWPLVARLALLRAAAGWALAGFRSDPQRSVADLTAELPPVLRHDLIDPLCVAALNTPSGEASAAVFLRVLQDALFSGPGSADLLLPRADLGALLPAPAAHWLATRGARLRLGTRVAALEPAGDRWLVDGAAFDAAIVATSSAEAIRLLRPHAPGWADTASTLRHEPIVTVYAQADGARLAEPMLALQGSEAAPAQFVFDRGRLGGPAGLLAFVISGAQAWVDRGAPATLDAVLAQARANFTADWPARLRPVQVVTEKRATFRCTPGLVRPAQHVARGLHVAGDFVAGPYPATLEGAVRAGVAAAAAIG
jgi:squalene-associated FAD-dependent desaturase